MNKAILIELAIATILVGCGSSGERSDERTDPIIIQPAPCTVTKTGQVTTIMCPDGTTEEVLDGQDGAKGDTGDRGNTGRAGVDGKDGSDGADGSNGADGRDGLDGTNGQPGMDGADGVDGLDAVIEVIDPCGDNPNQFDEVILRMGDGTTLLAFFEHKGKRFLTILSPGRYQTTDKQKCSFTVDINYNVVF